MSQGSLRIPDVAKVDLTGVQQERIFIEIEHRKLAILGLDPMIIVRTLQSRTA